jgi:hypothetical protein
MNKKVDSRPTRRAALVWVVVCVTALAGCGGGGGGGGGAAGSSGAVGGGGSGGGGGGGGTSAPPAATLSVAASASSATAGGQSVSLNATVANSTDPVTWVLTGPGAVSAPDGTSISYAPPLPDDLEADATATITATLGTLTQSVNVSLTTSPGHTWQVAQYPKPDWASAIYANGVYAVAGGVGTVLRSSDAVQWSTSYVGVANQVRALAWGPSGFVAAGFSGLLARSDDGSSWTMATPIGTPFSTPDLLAAAFGAGQYVVAATGNSGGLYSSVDGLHWTLADTGGVASFSDVIFGGGRFVATSGAGGEILYSDDGVTWTNTNCHCSAASLAWGNGLFVAFPGTGSSLTSSDGKVWVENLGAGVFAATLTFARGQFFAVSGAHLYASSDGTHWTLDYTLPGNLPAALLGLAGGPNAYILAGYEGQLLRSTDLSTWTPVSSDTRAGFTSVDYLNGVYVAVGDGGAVFRSTDATTWVAATTSLPTTISAVSHDGSRFLAVDSDTIFTSADGDTWSSTQLDLVGLGGIDSIAFAAGHYLAVGGPGLILTSTDAVTWNAVPSNLPASFQGVPGLASVAYGGGKFVAVGNHGAIVASTDAQNWTVVGNVDASAGFLGVSYGSSGGFVAVGSQGIIWQSADGTTWSQVTSPTTVDIEAVAYANSEYVAVGAGTVLTSQDGIHWHPRNANVGEYLYGVVGGGGRFVAVGTDGTVITSSR